MYRTEAELSHKAGPWQTFFSPFGHVAGIVSWSHFPSREEQGDGPWPHVPVKTSGVEFLGETNDIKTWQKMLVMAHGSFPSIVPTS